MIAFGQAIHLTYHIAILYDNFVNNKSSNNYFFWLSCTLEYKDVEAQKIKFSVAVIISYITKIRF